MAIETLDDIVEELMSKLGIYGACNQEGSGEKTSCTNENPCRCCASSGLTRRIREAVRVDSMMHEIQQQGMDARRAYTRDMLNSGPS